MIVSYSAFGTNRHIQGGSIKLQKWIFTFYNFVYRIKYYISIGNIPIIPNYEYFTDRFPLNNPPEFLKRWLIEVKRKNLVSTKYSSLCNEHFKFEDYQILWP